MSSIGSITATVQAVYSGAASRKVTPAPSTAPAREPGGDGDRSSPGDSIWAPEKGGLIDVYA